MKGWSPEWGKGPAAPEGQAGRARAGKGGGAALQAWARGDSYSDTGSAVAAATGARAAARPARDPRPPPRPPPLAPMCLRPASPRTPPVLATRKQRFRAWPLPNPRGSAGGRGDAETFPDPRPAQPPRAGAASERGTFQGSGKKTLPDYKE